MPKSKSNKDKKSKIQKSHYMPGYFKRGSGKLWLGLGKIVLAFSAWLLTIITVMLLYYSYDLPDLSKMQTPTRHRTVTLLAANGEVLANFGDLYGHYITYNDIPKNLINAVIATEDRRFFSHPGIDIIGIMRAMYTNYRAGQVLQGGSSISQQLAKIIFLKPERTLKRKIQEMILAFMLESKFTKKEILTIYLNKVYLGSGIYGIDAAAKYYFGKNIRNLNLYESALIAGLLKAPSRYNPAGASNDLPGKRAYQVLLNMYDAGFITAKEVRDADNHPIILRTAALGKLKSLYFANWVLDQLPDLIEDTSSNLLVKTTLDLTLQADAEHTLNKVLSSQGAKLGAHEGAITALTPSGKILAMAGGRNYSISPFNRVTQAERQAGSIFKLFVYGTAFENGYTPQTIMRDEPISIGNWQPKNFTRRHLGDITLATAFAQSVNTISVRLSENIGRQKIIEFAHRLGVSSPLTSVPSIALGSVEVNLLDLTGSFAVIANNGYAARAYGIEKISTDQGKVLYSKQPIRLRLLDSTVINYLREILHDAVTEGTGKKAAKTGEAIYGKTGTTQNYHDAWFIGFDNHLVAGVWVGNDDNKPMHKVTGGSLPAMIWREFMTRASGNDSKIELKLDELKEMYK